MPTLIAPVLKL